jgi:hypothetical protein
MSKTSKISKTSKTSKILKKPKKSKSKSKPTSTITNNNDKLEFIKENIYYLNLEELKTLCEKKNIYYKVYYRYKGDLHESDIFLRKKYILNNILKHIEKKKVDQYVIPEINVSFDLIDTKSNDKTKISKIKLSDKVSFGKFKWTTAKNEIFPENFKPVLCHFMLYDLWKKNKSFTYKEFIKFYNDNHDKYAKMDHPEWKYISDNRDGNNDRQSSDWKAKRTDISKKVIRYISSFMHQ